MDIQNIQDSDRRLGSQVAGPSTRPKAPTHHAAAAAAAAASVTDDNGDLILIGLAEMSKLRNIGCDNIFGPINGPNEGLPQYQVPRHWLERLHDAAPTTDSALPRMAETAPARPHPRPRPILAGRQGRANSVINQIDPSLLEPGGSDQTTNVMQPETCNTAPTSIPLATTVHTAGAEIATEPTVLAPNRWSAAKPGPSINLPNRPVTRSSTQRKVMTSDALAMQEAEALLKMSKRNRSQKKRQ